MILPDSNVSFKNFVSSLLVDFNTADIIPVDVNEDSWKQWGNVVATSTTFMKAGAPLADHFSDWRSWAKELYRRFG